MATPVAVDTLPRYPEPGADNVVDATDAVELVRVAESTPGTGGTDDVVLRNPGGAAEGARREAAGSEAGMGS